MSDSFGSSMSGQDTSDPKSTSGASCSSSSSTTIITTTTTTTPNNNNNNKPSLVLHQPPVKMSFGSLSNEITIYEIKTPGPNPHLKLINHFELVEDLGNMNHSMSMNDMDDEDEDDDDNMDNLDNMDDGYGETRMDAALMLETELMEDDPDNFDTPIEEIVTTTETEIHKQDLQLRHLNSTLSSQISSSSSRGRSPLNLQIIQSPITITPTTINPLINATMSNSSASISGSSVGRW